MRLTIFTAIVLFLFGCKNEKSAEKHVESSDLQGKWEVVNATKNGKVTKILDRSILDFHGKKVDANFCGAKDVDYTLNDNNITIKTDFEELKFEIMEVSGETLDVHLVTSNHEYDIIFKHKS